MAEERIIVCFLNLCALRFSAVEAHFFHRREAKSAEIRSQYIIHLATKIIDTIQARSFRRATEKNLP